MARGRSPVHGSDARTGSRGRTRHSQRNRSDGGLGSEHPSAIDPYTGRAMTGEKKPRAKPFTLFPMPFKEAIKRAIEAGPYHEPAKSNPRAGRAKAAVP